MDSLPAEKMPGVTRAGASGRGRAARPGPLRPRPHHRRAMANRIRVRQGEVGPLITSRFSRRGQLLVITPSFGCLGSVTKNDLHSVPIRFHENEPFG